MQNLGVDVHQVREAVQKHLLPGSSHPREMVPNGVMLTLLDRAASESRLMGNPFISTEHLLVGLASLHDTPALILRKFGVTPDTVRNTIQAMFSEQDPIIQQPLKHEKLVDALVAAAVEWANADAAVSCEIGGMECDVIPKGSPADQAVERLVAAESALHALCRKLAEKGTSCDTKSS